MIKLDFEKRAESNSRQINQLLAELDQHARDFSDVADAHGKSTKETYGNNTLIQTSMAHSS
jgi:F0F1-type ATP synthase assembly protein I